MKVFKKFLCVLSMLVTALFVSAIAACDVSSFLPSGLNSTASSNVLDSAEQESEEHIHSFTNYVDDNNAACGKNATQTANCDGCEATDTRELEGTALEHSYTNYVDDNNTTCGKNATKTAICDNGCGTTHTREIEGTAVEHVYTNYIEDNNASCGKNATKTAVCENGCGIDDVIEIPNTALTHVYTNYVSNNDAACEKNGTKTAACDNGCGEKSTVEDEGTALAHVYTNYTTNGDETCQKDGTKTALCDNGCGKKDTVANTGSRVGHTFENYVLNGDATCEEDGTKTGACKYGCGETETVVAVGSALGHTFHLSVCVRCPQTNYLSVVTAPTATMAYYGDTATFASGAVKNELGATVSNGAWSITSADYTANGSEKSVSTTATATFTPNGTEYAPVSTEIMVTLTAVAKYSSNYYVTVDGAIAAANEKNGGKVTVLPLGSSIDTGKAKTAKTISVVTEIKSGVVVFMPYVETVDDVYAYVNVSDSAEYKTSAYGKVRYQNNQIYIAQNHTLTNAGTINVAGEVSGGTGGNYGANSVTAGRHAQINLGKNAKLISTGTVNCYGFINEESKNNGSEFIVESGEATVMFTIYEYHGARMYLGLIDPNNSTVNKKIASAAIEGSDIPILGKKLSKYTPDSLQVSPMSRFYIGSVTAKTTVKYGAEMLGNAVLFADGDNHATTINLINNTDGIIGLTAKGGYVTYKYDSSTHKTDLDIYGDMTLNPLQLKLTISKSVSKYTTKIEITLTTGKTGNSSGVFFPISEYFDISLNAVNGSATVNAQNQKLKLLPGAKLTIGEGVVVNASEIAVYASNSLLNNGANGYYATNTPAELTVKGTLNVNKIGGKVKVGGDNAVLKITSGASVISKEISSTLANQTATINLYVTNASLDYTGIVYATDAASTLTATGGSSESLAVGTYSVQGGKWTAAA